MPDDSYLLSGGTSELERLRLQARVWEPAAEGLLDQLSVGTGWNCVDLGCGAMGILGPLSKRVGTAGHVTGVDLDAKQLAAARSYVKELGLSNVEIAERDAYDTHLPNDSFDLSHVRFLFAPVGRDDELIREMLRITKHGGIIAVQEPDASSWNCFPENRSWVELKDLVLAAFSKGGGDFNAGTRIFRMLRQAGLADVKVRASILALQDKHPYMRLPIQFAASLRKRIVEGNLMKEDELQELVSDCEKVLDNKDVFALTFVLVQAWGRKP